MHVSCSCAVTHMTDSVIRVSLLANNHDYNGVYVYVYVCVCVYMYIRGE